MLFSQNLSFLLVCIVAGAQFQAALVFISCMAFMEGIAC